MLGCMHALLLAGAITKLINVDGGTARQWAEVQGQPTTVELIRQHAAPSQPAAASPSDEPGVSSPILLPAEILLAAERGELQKVVSWLRKERPVDALHSARTIDGQTATVGLLHAAAAGGQLEMVRELLKRGASVDLPSGLGFTALMEAAYQGHLSIVLLLLQHSANRDVQNIYGTTALMMAAHSGHEACVQALLRAGANTELRTNKGLTALLLAEDKGHTATAKLIRQHAARPQPAAAPPQPATATPATPTDAVEPAVSPPPTSLHLEIYYSAGRGELQKVNKWLRRGGPIDTLGPVPTADGQIATVGLLHAAAAGGQLEMMRELLKRGASVDLQSGLGGTALMDAAGYGHLSVLLLLLQHSANPDLQDVYGATALMMAEAEGHTATAELLRQHASCLSLGLGVALCAVVPLAWPWMVLSVVLGAIVAVAPHASQAAQAARSARADAAMEKLLAEEEAEQAKAQASSKKSKKKKAGCAAATGDEPSEAPPPAAPAPAPAAAPKPAASAAEPAKAALRAAIAGGRLSALEATLAAVPCQVRESGVGVEARARCDRLLEAQQEAERKARQEAAAEAARLAAVKRVREMTAEEAVRAVAASKARAVAVAAAATAAAAVEAAAAAEAKADALERATIDGGEGGGSAAAGPSEAGEVAVPDQYMCPITADIMTDPVITVDGFTYERTAISEWLRTKDTSPSTGATLESKTVIPNLSLRSIIRSFAEAHGTLPPAV
eukprot:scaffold48181_cov63-Phaeocystis_antarctica.AAC.2